MVRHEAYELTLQANRWRINGAVPAPEEEDMRVGRKSRRERPSLLLETIDLLYAFFLQPALSDDWTKETAKIRNSYACRSNNIRANVQIAPNHFDILHTRQIRSWQFAVRSTIIARWFERRPFRTRFTFLPFKVPRHGRSSSPISTEAIGPSAFPSVHANRVAKPVTRLGDWVDARHDLVPGAAVRVRCARRNAALGDPASVIGSDLEGAFCRLRRLNLVTASLGA